MIRKLIKYELKCTARYLIPMFAALICLAAISRIILSITALGNGVSLITMLLDSTFFMAAIVFTAASFIVQIIQYYKSMVTDEAYQTFSLPVNVESLTKAKLLASLICNVSTIAVVCASARITTGSTASGVGSFLKELELFAAQLKLNTAVLIVFGIFMLLLTLVMYHLFIQAAISIGQTFENNKIGFTFAAGILLYLAALIIMLLGVVIIGMFAEPESIEYLQAMGIFLVIFMLSINVIMYCITNYIFRKKLNLE